MMFYLHIIRMKLWTRFNNENLSRLVTYYEKLNKELLQSMTLLNDEISEE